MDSSGLESEKLYYSIGEVSTMLDVNASLIRFWEKEFDDLHPKKNNKGNRLFKKDDIELLKRIYELVKVKGYTLQGARESLKKGNAVIDDHARAELHERLTSIRRELLDIMNRL